MEELAAMTFYSIMIRGGESVTTVENAGITQ